MFLLSNIKNSIKFFFIVRTKSTGCTGSASLGAKNDQPLPSSAGSTGLRHLCQTTLRGVSQHFFCAYKTSLYQLLIKVYKELTPRLLYFVGWLGPLFLLRFLRALLLPLFLEIFIINLIYHLTTQILTVLFRIPKILQFF